VLGAGPAGPEAALAAAFTPALADFDALLRLRRAALPAADRALLPAAAAAAAALRCGVVEAGGCGAAADAAPGSRAQAVLHAIPAGVPGVSSPPLGALSCVRRRPPAQAALPTSTLKRARAGVVTRRGAAGLAAELLVGADPVAALATALDARFGGVALLCADALGGALLGVKWRAQARAQRARACPVAAACGG